MVSGKLQFIAHERETREFIRHTLTTDVPQTLLPKYIGGIYAPQVHWQCVPQSDTANKGRITHKPRPTSW